VNDWIILSVLTAVELFVLIKMRFKIDFSGTLTLFVHLFVSLVRLIGDYAVSTNAAQKVLFLNGVNMIWLSLYYFICELMHIQNSLESADHLIYRKQSKLINIIKHAMFIIFLLYSASISVSQYFLYSDVKFYQENVRYFNVSVVISRSIKFALDLFFHIKFLQLFIYLVRKSKEKGEISIIQKFIKFFILFLYGVGLIYAVLVYISMFE
jgi:hypothetical protein